MIAAMMHIFLVVGLCAGHTAASSLQPSYVENEKPTLKVKVYQFTFPEKNTWSISHGKQKICAGGPYTNWYAEAQTDCKLATGSYSITCCDTLYKEGWSGGYVRIEGTHQKLCKKFQWNAGKECYKQKFDVVVPTPKPTPVPTPKPTFPPAFRKCTGDNWCLQANTFEQYTRCEKAEDHGQTCINPEIRWGSTVGGVPTTYALPYVGSSLDWWCAALGSGFGSKAYVSQAVNARSCAVGALCLGTGCTPTPGYYAWCDMGRGGYQTWKNKPLKWPCTGYKTITKLTCKGPIQK